MRIGILTFHDADNLGCVLQCFGLQETVKKLAPDAEVEIINFKRINDIPQSNVIDEEKKIRKKKFNSFRADYMNISKIQFKDIDDLPEDRYDLCIVGSDQVWNYHLIEGKEKAYFLWFAGDNTRKISYAASIGSGIDDVERMKWLSKWLGGMDAISVREKSALEVVRSITAKSVTPCVDPTLLHDRFFWEKYEKKPIGLTDEKYIFMYALGYNWCREEERKAAQMACELAESKGLAVIHYYYGRLREWFPEGSKHCFCEGPQEMLWLFHHAEVVICCSFHGTAFSVIYEKPFYTFYTPGNGSRMKDLVTELGIPERYIDKPLSLGK